MPGKVVSVTRQALELMRSEADALKPEEACGLLVGRCDDRSCRIEEVVPMVNTSKSPVRFSIDPEEMYQVLLEAQKKGLTVIGSYHSHPTGAVPSCLDAKYMENTSYVWMIVPAAGKVRAYTFEEGVKEMKIEEPAY